MCGVPVEVDHILSASMVLAGVNLVPGELDKRNFATASNVEVRQNPTFGIGPVMPSLAPNLSPNSERLDLDRERISLELHDDRSVVKQDFPTGEALGRLSEIAWLALANTPDRPPMLTLGYNIEMLLRATAPRSAIEVIGDAIFAPGLAPVDGAKVIGGTARIMFEFSGSVWQITLEPRINETASGVIFMSLNDHHESVEMPKSQEHILNGFLLTWVTAHQFVAATLQKVGQ